MSEQGFSLSLPALQRLAGAIASVHGDLAAQDATRADIDEIEAGDAEMFAAIRTFDDNWRTGRARVVDNLARTGNALTDTLRNYATAEDHVSGQFGAS